MIKIPKKLPAKLSDGRLLIKIEKEILPTKSGRSKGFIKRTFWLKCLTCGKLMPTPPKRFNNGNYKYCSRKCASDSFNGKGNPNYKNGKKNGFLYWQKKIRPIALKNANNKCEICKYGKYPQILSAHHKLPRRLHGKDIIENCLIVCPNCHYLIHRGIIDNDGNKLPKDKNKGIHNY